MGTSLFRYNTSYLQNVKINYSILCFEKKKILNLKGENEKKKITRLKNNIERQNEEVNSHKGVRRQIKLRTWRKHKEPVNIHTPKIIQHKKKREPLTMKGYEKIIQV